MASPTNNGYSPSSGTHGSQLRSQEYTGSSVPPHPGYVNSHSPLPGLGSVSPMSLVSTSPMTHTLGSERAKSNPSSPAHHEKLTKEVLEAKVKDLKKVQTELKGLIIKLKKRESVTSSHLDEVLKTFLEGALKFRRIEIANATSHASIADLDFIRQVSDLIASGKRDGTGHYHSDAFSDRSLNTLLQSLLVFIRLKANSSIRFTKDVPHLFENLGALITREHVASGWAAYLVAHLVLEQDSLIHNSIQNVESIINAAFKTILNGSDEQSDGCLLLINNFISMGRDEIVNFIAKHSELMIIFNSFLSSHAQNATKIQRIASIIHHLSRYESVASILILKKVPELLHGFKESEFSNYGHKEADFPAYFGLATMALANLSPSLGSWAVSSDTPSLTMVVEFMKFTLDNRPYKGISFKVLDILRALSNLCSHPPNHQILLNAGVVEVLQKSLQLNTKATNFHSVVDCACICAVRLIDNAECCAMMIQVDFYKEIEELNNIPEADVGNRDFVRLRWPLRDQPNLIRNAQDIHQHINSLRDIIKSSGQDDKIIMSVLKAHSFDVTLAEAANTMLRILNHENPETVELRRLLQVNHKELESVQKMLIQKEEFYAQAARHESEVALSRAKAVEEDKAMTQALHAHACQILLTEVDEARSRLQAAEKQLERIRAEKVSPGTTKVDETLRSNQEFSLLETRYKAIQQEKDTLNDVLSRTTQSLKTVQDQNEALQAEKAHFTQETGRMRNELEQTKIGLKEVEERLRLAQSDNAGLLAEKKLWSSRDREKDTKHQEEIRAGQLAYSAEQKIKQLMNDLDLSQRKLHISEAKNQAFERTLEKFGKFTGGIYSTEFSVPASDNKPPSTPDISLNHGSSDFAVEDTSATKDSSNKGGGSNHDQANHGGSDKKPFPQKDHPGLTPKHPEVCLGLSISTGRSPFLVLGVHELMDSSGITQGHDGYNNEKVEIGDELREVNGTEIDGFSFHEVMSALRGPAGTVADLRFRRFIRSMTKDYEIRDIKVSVLRHIPRLDKASGGKSPIVQSPSKHSHAFHMRVCIGLTLDTTCCPFRVSGVHDLMDTNSVLQGQTGYINDYIVIGDHLAEIDGKSFESCAFKDVVAALSGPHGSVVHLTFRRTNDHHNSHIKISVVRHKTGGSSSANSPLLLFPGGVREFGNAIGEMSFLRQ